MKNLLIIAAVAFFCIPLSLHAQSQLDRELTQLEEQQAKALAAAIEPVNRRFQTALESLLRRATQANDLATANKINDELKKLGASSQAATESSGVTIESLTKKLIGTKWVWFGGETITFLADGKAQWKESPVFWPWKVTSAGRRVVEGQNVGKGKNFTITFEHDLKSGTVEGDGGNRKIQIISP